MIDFLSYNSHMNVIFQALAYVSSVREYSEKHYEHIERLIEKTKKVVGLFHAMYTDKFLFDAHA